MRIIHYIGTTDSAGGGGPRTVLDCARVLSARGHSVTVLASDVKDSPREWLDAESGGHGYGGEGMGAPRVHRIPHPTLPGEFFTRAALLRLRSELERCDVLHLNDLWSRVSFQLATLAREIGIPYVLTLHGLLDDWAMTQSAFKKRAYLSLLGRRMLEGAARVHCMSQGEFDQSSKWHAGCPTVVPPLVDLQPFRTLPGPDLARRKHEFLRDTSRPTVLFLSRLHPSKGLEHLIRASARLRDEGVHFNTALVGKGDTAYVDSLGALTSELHLNDRVKFLGHVQGDEKLSVFQAADLFVLPTLQENFGLVLLEAMACGTPIVTTRGADTWKQFQSSGAASIVGDTARELAPAMRQILTQPGLRRRMAELARPWVLREFDEARTIGRYEALYRESVARAPLAPEISNAAAAARTAPARPRRPVEMEPASEVAVA